MPAIEQVSKIRQPPTTTLFVHTGDIRWIGKAPDLVTSLVPPDAGYDFVKTMKLKLAQGRGLLPRFSNRFGGFHRQRNRGRWGKWVIPIRLGKPVWWG